MFSLSRHGSGSARGVRRCRSGCQEEDPRGPAQTTPPPKPQETGQPHPYCSFLCRYWQEAVRATFHGQEWWVNGLDTLKHQCTHLLITKSAVCSTCCIILCFVHGDHTVYCVVCKYKLYVFIYNVVILCMFFPSVTCCLISHFLLLFVFLHVCVCVCLVRCILHVCVHVFVCHSLNQ